MRRKAETIRFERAQNERKDAEEKRAREVKERQKALELTKKREALFMQKKREKEEREREKESERVRERERKAKAAAMWSPRTQNVELRKYAAAGREKTTASPKSPNDVFYDAKETLPAVQSRMSIMEKSSVGNKGRNEPMNGEEEELVRKKTKTLSIAGERSETNKSPLSSSSGGNGGVRKTVRRPSMLSNPPTKKPSTSYSSSALLSRKQLRRTILAVLLGTKIQELDGERKDGRNQIATTSVVFIISE